MILYEASGVKLFKGKGVAQSIFSLLEAIRVLDRM